MKLIVIGILALLLVGGISIINNYEEDFMEEDNKIFQGPVRPTDDLEYFRETGITKPMEIKE